MTDEDESDGATRRQVLAGAAGVATVPAWASVSEETAAAYARNIPAESTGHTQDGALASIEYYEEPREEFEIKLRSFPGDTEHPRGIVDLSIEIGPFRPSVSFSVEQARGLASKFRAAANDAEVMTRAHEKDYREARND